MSTSTLSNHDVTGAIIDWLTSQPSSDVAEEAQLLTTHLDALYGPGVSSAQFHRCIELFYSRALRLCDEFRRDMRSQQLPLPAERVATARQLIAALIRVVSGFERVLTDARQGAIRTQRRLNETASARALRLLAEQFLVTCQSGLEPAPELWTSAYNLYSLSRMEAEAHQPPGSPAETALYVYKRLLGLASLDPHSLSAAELDWAGEFLTRTCGQVHVQEERPHSVDGAWYWLDPAKDAEPQACVRRDPPSGRKLVYFSTSGLARRAAELLAKHEGGRAAPELEVSEQYPGVQPIALLGRLRQRWSSPPRRDHPRRRQQYDIEACVGLPNIWKVLRGKGESKPGELVSRWNVLNESPGGFSIMHVQGLTSGIASGMAIALRRDPAEPWNVCVVRWLRSDSPDEVEIGLQIVSKGAIPVQVGFRGNDRHNPMAESLVLPVLPALRQHQAVLAPAGTYTSRRFSLVSDIDRLYIAQGRLLSLDMQTSHIELFQFEIDPYPI